MAKKEFTYRGFNLEALKKMCIEDFTELVDARRRRTLKRNNTDFHKKLLKKIRNSNQDKLIRTHCRDFIILPEFVGRVFAIHNGKEFVRVEIMPEMVGSFLGEFSQTRKRTQHSSPGVGATRGSKYIALK